MAVRLDRRTVLRGIGGAMVGLPALECMLDSNGVAYAQTRGPIPRRYAIVFAGQSLGGDDWAKDSSRIAGQFIQETGHFIAPLTTGADYAITTPLIPLTDLKSDFSIVSNSCRASRGWGMATSLRPSSGPAVIRTTRPRITFPPARTTRISLSVDPGPTMTPSSTVSL